MTPEMTIENGRLTSQGVVRTGSQLSDTEISTRPYSTSPSPSHPSVSVNRTRKTLAGVVKRESTSRRSVESLSLLSEQQQKQKQKQQQQRSNKVGRSIQGNLGHDDSLPRDRNEDWGSELSTLELKPPSGFSDAHEMSEAECDIDMKLKLQRKRPGPVCNSLSKSPKDFTITV